VEVQREPLIASVFALNSKDSVAGLAFDGDIGNKELYFTRYACTI
jgi:hypothetical protein